MEITKFQDGDVKAEVKFEKGEIVAVSNLDAKGLKAELKVVVPTDYFFDELAKAIPGVIDDAVIALIKNAVKAL